MLERDFPPIPVARLRELTASPDLDGLEGQKTISGLRRPEERTPTATEFINKKLIDFGERLTACRMHITRVAIELVGVANQSEQIEPSPGKIGGAPSTMDLLALIDHDLTRLEAQVKRLAS
jgi:hypothetical protein